MRKKKRSDSISILRDERSGEKRKHDVVAGRLYWLPEKADLDKKLVELFDLIEDGCFGHPVVVLGVDKTRKIAVVFIVTSLGGKPIAWYADRRKYLAIYPAENAYNSTQLFLKDELVLEKISYVTTVTQLTLSWKMLKPYRNRQSSKQYKLKPDSLAELLKHADLSLLLAPVSKGVDIVPVPSTAALHSFPLQRPLAPLSGNAVLRPYETDIERLAGLNLPSHQATPPPSTVSTRYNPTILPQPPGVFSAWGTNSLSLSATSSYWDENTQHTQHPPLGGVRGDYSFSLRSPLNERSALLPNYSNQSPQAQEQNDAESVTTASSWFTGPRVLLAVLGVVAIGYFSFGRRN